MSAAGTSPTVVKSEDVEEAPEAVAALEEAVDAAAAGGEPAPEPTEVDVLDPQPGKTQLADGTEVDIVPLRSRELFALMRILTRSGVDFLSRVDLKVQDPQVLTGQLVAMFGFAIPDAEDEAIDFVRKMVRPPATGDDKKDRAARQALWIALDNPELDDMITVVEAVIRREMPNLQALGRRLATMVKFAQATGQVQDSSEDSPERST